MNTKKMIEEAMARIVYVQELQEAYLAVKTALQRRDRNFRDTGPIYALLMSWELDEWRGLMMWGLFCDDPTRDRLKAAAHERFLHGKMHVADWFQNGQSPERWLAADDEAFRKMANEAFFQKEA
jgi:hypothetical protein